jgi:hypothetical protein
MLALLRRVLTVVLVTLAAVAILAPAAGAYRLAGNRWPGGSIAYHDDGPNREAVRRAVAAWNTSGARVRFTAVPRARAQVLIRRQGARACSGQLGHAPLGFASRAGVAVVRLRPCGDLLVATQAAVHELGHVLGLDHESRRCAVMNPLLAMRCGRPRPYHVYCRLLELDDVRGAVRLYGGRAKAPATPRFCPLFAAPARVTGFAVGPDASGFALAARFRLPATRRLLGPGPAQPPYVRARMYVYAGRCPASAPKGRPLAERSLQPGTGALSVTIPIGYHSVGAPGPYCFAVTVRDATGRAGPTTKTLVRIARPVAQAAFDAVMHGSTVYVYDSTNLPTGAGELVDWQWDFGDPGHLDNTLDGSLATHRYSAPGTYAITLTVTDEYGRQSSTTREVVVEDV